MAVPKTLPEHLVVHDFQRDVYIFPYGEEITAEEYYKTDVEVTLAMHEQIYGIGTYQEKEQNMDTYTDNLSRDQIEQAIEKTENSLARLMKRSEAGALKPAYVKTRKATLQQQLDDLMEARQKFVRRDDLLIAMKLVGENFEAEDVLLFKRNFRSKGEEYFSGRQPVYTYAAVKVASNLWYITGRNASRGVTWDDLVREHLYYAWIETGEVWFASEWQKVLNDE